jgi:beta-lactamase regulating signal transducer with metallopeptidase domain
MIFLSENIDYALGWMVIHSLWQATLIALISGTVLIFLRKKSAKIKYLIANIALFSVLLTSGATFYGYYNSISQPIAIDFSQIKTELPLSKKSAVQNTMEITSPTVSPTVRVWSVANFHHYFEQNLPLIVTVWLLGVAVFLLRLLGSISYIYYLRTRMNFPPDEYWVTLLQRLTERAGLRKTIELVESALVRTPMVVGYLKPLILFPLGTINRLTEQEVEAILAHELAHIMRHDYLFNILQSIVEALFYYHPAVWWMSAQIRDERESACDEIAIDLLGNAMKYAKALVLIQELTFFPYSPSLAFAGQGKNQFLMRMQRILNQPQNKSNIMEKLIATLLVVFTLIGLGIAQTNSPKYIYSNITENVAIRTKDDGVPLKASGFWNAKIEKDEVCITFNNSEKGNMWITNECFSTKELSAIPTQEAEFSITRAAGTLTLKGKFEGNEGYGKQTFVADPTFKKILESKGLDTKGDELTFDAFLANVTTDYFEQLQKLGLRDLSSEQVQTFLVHRITVKVAQDYINAFAANATKPSAEEIIGLKVHDIDVAYIQKMNNANNTQLSPEQIMTSKVYNLQPEKIAELEKIVGQKLNHEEQLNFSIHGIDAAYIKDIQRLVSNKLSVDDIVGAKNFGFTFDFVNSFYAVGMSKSNNIDELLALKIHDLKPSDFQAFASVGLKNISAESLAALKIANVTVYDVIEARKKGEKSTDAMTYVDLKYRNFSEAIEERPNEVPVEQVVEEPTRKGNFGRLSDGNEITWFNGAYKIIEENGKIKKAYQNGVLMSQQQLKSNADILQKQIDEVRMGSKENSRLAIMNNLAALKNADLALQDALKAQKNAELGELSFENGKLATNFFRQIVKDGLVKTNQKTKILLTEKQLSINGKQLPADVHARYKDEILKKMYDPKKEGKFKVALDGVIEKVEGDELMMNGTYTIDFNDGR